MTQSYERRITSAPVDLRGQFLSVTHKDVTIQNAASLMRLPFSENRPAFVAPRIIEQQAERISSEVVPHIMLGISRFVQKEGLGSDSLATREQQQAWLWAVKASKYNAIYFVSRQEAEKGLDFVKKHVDLIDAIGEFIDEHGGIAPVANYALHSYARGWANVKQVKRASEGILQTAIQGYDDKTIVVKEGNFLDSDPTRSFDIPDEIYDWHDLAHVLAAVTSKGAFGVKFHGHYDQVQLGQGIDEAGRVFEDGFVFGNLSRKIFEFYEQQFSFDKSGRELLNFLVARDLFVHFAGKPLAYHEEEVRKRPIDPIELAVSEQVKRYERRAAEVETNMFVRGTPEGPRGKPDRDPLLPLTRSQRIEQIAALGDEPLYFEARNLTRHRAHEDALGQFAGYLLVRKREQLTNTTGDADQATLAEDIRLLEATVDFYQMNDLRRGEDINLYQFVGDILNTRKNRNA